MTKFKIGDKVRLRDDLKVGEKYGNLYFSSFMKTLKGKEQTINGITSQGNYELEESCFFYSEEMLEKGVDDMNKKDLKDGMIVTLRRGDERVIIGECLFNEQGPTATLTYYNDDLTSMHNVRSDDIMKIEYGGEIIWERETEWDNMPFGTKVRAWDYNDKYKLVGKFIAYDEDDKKKPFLVFIEDQKDTYWFDHCELIEGGDIVG